MNNTRYWVDRFFNEATEWCGYTGKFDREGERVVRGIREEYQREVIKVINEWCRGSKEAVSLRRKLVHAVEVI